MPGAPGPSARGEPGCPSGRSAQSGGRRPTAKRHGRCAGRRAGSAGCRRSSWPLRGRTWPRGVSFRRRGLGGRGGALCEGSRVVFVSEVDKVPMDWLKCVDFSGADFILCFRCKVRSHRTSDLESVTSQGSHHSVESQQRGGALVPDTRVHMGYKLEADE